MAGFRDLKKRHLVCKMLRVPKWQRASDNAVARTAGVSRYLVADVRKRMIGDGSHPAPSADGRDPRACRLPEYRAGGSARGGYVYGPGGTPVRETEYLRRRALEIGGRVGRAVLALLAELRDPGSAPPARRPTSPRSRRAAARRG